MRKPLAAVLAAAFLAAIPVAGTAGATGDRNDTCGRDGRRDRLEIVGLTKDQRLTCFKENRPGRARTIGALSGFDGDTVLVGIDVRPATGELYGLGDKGGIYIVDPATAKLRRMARANMALDGASFGVDFNPAADRLRVVSDKGQNLAINVVDGVVAPGGALAYTPPTPPTGAVGAMYTNNDADPNTNTTLFDIDPVLDQLAIQSPPNAGSLVATGKLGVDTGLEVGADIYSRVKNGTTVENRAFAALSSGGSSSFYGVDVLTGRASQWGTFPYGDVLIGIAVAPGQ